jgi:hypothetical protein
MSISESATRTDRHHVATTVDTLVRIANETSPTTAIRLGAGKAVIDTATGTPVQFIDDEAPGRAYLLDSAVEWHSVEHSWGTGHVIGDAATGRWNAPATLEIVGDVVRSTHRISHALSLDVERHGGEVLKETYRFRNTSDEHLRITGLGVQTPFADLYPSADDALSRRVHAHVFTGGAWAWVAAQPMDGAGRILGLRVTAGHLWGYSVETRNSNTISNARGHLVLGVTDHARNADAFGGQPVIELSPGAEYVLAWEISWFENMDDLVAATRAPAEFSSFSAAVGERIGIRTSQRVSAGEGVSVVATPDGVDITADRAGTYTVQIGSDARTEVLFHDSVETAVRKRCRYVLEHQISGERPGLLAHAIVPVDTATLLTQTTNGWSDWSDGSERIGVAQMLQHALIRGWVDASAEDVLSGWAEFAERFLLDDTAAPRRGSQDQHTGIRLYDSPWLAQFFLLRHRESSSAAPLDLAARIIERALELGIGRFLTIGFSEVTVDIAEALEAAERPERAESLREAVIASARHFASIGADLPGHEVSYEQSIVAPLLSLLTDAHRLSGDPVLLDAIAERLPWLLAFGGPQPHARLNGIAIRHWDGFWFGQRRQWGDVFPHYWSALTAGVLLRLPEELRTPHTQRLADTVLRANMANYFDDGSATCAFVMPTSVDGVAAHAADPLANDQDFHLSMWMQLESDGLTVLG